MKNNIKHIFFMTIFLAILVLAQSSHNYDKLLLQDLKTFTVFKNRVTKGRRSRVLQLECTEGDACQYFQPQSMQCIQIGFDGYNASWKCETQLEDYYYLGYTKVSCEGYSYPDDKYITRDSCGVRYSLYLTEKGKEHFRNNSNTHNHRRTNNNNEDDNNYSSDSGFYLLVVIAIIIVIYIIYQFYKSWKETHNGNNTNNNNNNAENQSVTTNANVNSETEKLESQINDSNNKKENTVVKTENKNDNNNKLEETSSTENKAQENTRALSEKDHGDNNYEKPIIVGRNQTKYSNNYYIEQFNKYKEEYSRKKLEEQKMNNAEKPKENQEALKNEQPSYDIEDVKTSETEQASTSTRNLSIENENEVVNEHKEDNKKVNNFQSYSRTILNTLKDGITGLATSSKFVDDVFSAQPLEIIEDTNLQQHSNENIQEKEQKVQKEQKEQNEVIVEKEEKKDKGKEEEKEEKKQNEQSIQNQINEKKDEKEQEEEEEEEEEVLEEGPLIEMKEVEPEELVQSGDIVDFSHSPSKRQIEAVKALDAENDNENLPKIEMNEVNVNEYIKNGEIEEFSNGIINYEDIKDVEQKYPPNLDQEQNKLKVPSDELSQVISEDSFDYHKYSPTKLEESSNLSESRSLNVSEELELLRAEMTFEGDPTPNFKKRTSLHKKSPPTPDNSSGENEEALNSNEDKNGKYKKIQKEIFEQEYKKVEEDSVSEELKDLMEEELIKLDETGEESVYDNKVQGKPVDSKSRTNSDDFELLEFNVNDNPKIERQTKQKRTDEELLNEYEII